MNAHFKVLYSTFYPKVYANCMMILKNPTMAEEAAQEAFLKAYEKLFNAAIDHGLCTMFIFVSGI